MPPLRPRGWRLAGNGGCGEIGLGIRAALTAGVGAVVVDKQAAAAKVLLQRLTARSSTDGDRIRRPGF